MGKIDISGKIYDDTVKYYQKQLRLIWNRRYKKNYKGDIYDIYPTEKLQSFFSRDRKGRHL